MESNPIYLHKNLYEPKFEEIYNFLLTIGGRCKVSKRTTINAEYGVLLNARETCFYHNSAIIDMDVQTFWTYFSINSSGNLGLRFFCMCFHQFMFLRFWNYLCSTKTCFSSSPL